MWYLYENAEDFVKHVYETLCAVPGNATTDLKAVADNGGRKIDVYFESAFYNRLTIDFNVSPNTSDNQGGWEDRGRQKPTGYFNVQLGGYGLNGNAHYMLPLNEFLRGFSYMALTPSEFDKFMKEVESRISVALFPDKKGDGS